MVRSDDRAPIDHYGEALASVRAQLRDHAEAIQAEIAAARG